MAERTHWPNGPRIEALMRKSGYSTGEEFSRAINEAISTRNIQLILTGKKKHKESTLQLIADAFSVALDEIVLPDGQQEASGAPAACPGDSSVLTIQKSRFLKFRYEGKDPEKAKQFLQWILKEHDAQSLDIEIKEIDP